MICYPAQRIRHHGNPHRSITPVRGERFMWNMKGDMASKRTRPSGCSA
jgi:hypothetical protein